MRIPVNSCQDCADGNKFLSAGVHIGDDGKHTKCPFIVAEMSDFPNCEFIGAYHNRKIAVHVASRSRAALIWSGQGPVEFWIVLRDKK